MRYDLWNDRLASALMETAAFSHAENFLPVEAEGLDAAWGSQRMEVVAVKGVYVARVIYLGGGSRDFDPREVCQALAEKWRSP